jgi:hypothetical protein
MYTKEEIDSNDWHLSQAEWHKEQRKYLIESGINYRTKQCRWHLVQYRFHSKLINFSILVSQVLRKHQTYLLSNVTKYNALYNRLINKNKSAVA